MKPIILAFFIGIHCTPGFTQNLQTISGYIVEAGSGETMIGVNIFLKDQVYTGTVSNHYGFYSLSLAEGEYTLVFSYTGYQSMEQKIILTKATELDVSLLPGVTMEEVVITAEDVKKNVTGTEMGTVEVNMEVIKKLPALMGEVDLLKTLQLLPGVSSATEGTAGLYIRGGGPDQNLVLLDEAVVYNTGHLLGFFSVFNSDAIKNTTLIKGSMPADYGGRISSVIDIQMKEGNNERYVLEGGIGLIASRLTVQGPIQKKQSSFIISGRRTYALDLAQPFIKNTSAAGTNYYFYDLNLKLNYIISRKDRIYASAYFGRDVFKFANSERDFSISLPYGNGTATMRWNHTFSDNIFMNVALIYNDYNFELHGAQEDFSFDLNSGVRDVSIKADLDYYPNPKHHLKSGIRYTYHKLSPNIINATNGEVDFSSDFKPKYGHENELYFMDNWTVNSTLKINAGVRFPLFLQVGPYVSEERQKTFGSGELVESYFLPEPRISFNKTLTNNSSIKGGITVARQFLHLVSNSGSTLPTDIWVPSSEKVKPQFSIQYALGYYRNWLSDLIESSVEIYYKDLKDQLDYRESYVESFSSDIENEFVSGTGRAYGIEFFVRKSKGKFTGWVGYTLSKTERWFDEIEKGRIFPTTYDRPHDLVLVGSYGLSPSWDVSANFIYATGRAFTPIQSLFLINNRPNVEYGPRNSDRLEDYHRMDISFTYANAKKKNKAFQSSWAFSVYNVYNRKNPFFTYTDFETDILSGTASAKAVKVSLFTIIPSVTWNFYWKS
ncbi:MAG: TonB-dependent receptor [Bacteroidota bacterium]|nr:TonB-dependent receptor [Bacteroidota bacterium]